LRTTGIVGETSFLMYLTLDDRIRHSHISVKGRIVRFAIQYEALIQGRWFPVVRYDNYHGFAHMNRMHPDGSVEKVALPNWGYNEALTFAQDDIRSNWEWYRERYEKKVKK